MVVMKFVNREELGKNAFAVGGCMDERIGDTEKENMVVIIGGEIRVRERRDSRQ